MVMASTAASTSASTSGINSELHKLDDTVQDREGNVYRTVKIGEQVWLAENLRSTQFQDGSAVHSGAVPNDDAANLLTYGRLYNWHDVSDERNLCPVGWRVATDDDWKTLERTYINGNKFYSSVSQRVSMLILAKRNLKFSIKHKQDINS